MLLKAEATTNSKAVSIYDHSSYKHTLGGWRKKSNELQFLFSYGSEMEAKKNHFLEISSCFCFCSQVMFVLPIIMVTWIHLSFAGWFLYLLFKFGLGTQQVINFLVLKTLEWIVFWDSPVLLLLHVVLELLETGRYRESPIYCCLTSQDTDLIHK